MGDERKDYEVQDVIENSCIYKTPVTVIVYDIDFINKMLSEGQYFFTDIEKEGIMLYDAGRVALAEHRPLSPMEAKAISISKEYFLGLYNELLTKRKYDWNKVEEEVVKFYSINDFNAEDGEKLFISRLSNDFSLRKEGLGGSMDMPNELKDFLNGNNIYNQMQAELDVYNNFFPNPA